MGHSTKKKYFTPDCGVAGCGNQRKHGCPYCPMHVQRLRRNGHLGPNRRPNGSGTIMKSGHISIKIDNAYYKYGHVIVAERALGKKLPTGAQVHHVNLNPSDNRPSNLVICPDDAYHKLLHKRQRALDECGNANYRKCWICKHYDNPTNLTIRTGKKGTQTVVHLECEREHNNARWPKRKTQRAAAKTKLA